MSSIERASKAKEPLTKGERVRGGVSYRGVRVDVAYIEIGAGLRDEETHRFGGDALTRTELCFTHVGLAPTIECYGSCSDAWGFYINHSLFALITKGEGKPSKEKSETREKASQA